MSPVRPFVLVSIIWLTTRTAVDLLGLPMNFSLDWMFLADPGDLRDRLLHTTFHAHSFPPGMNLLAGLLLKLGAAAQPAAHALFLMFGLVLVSALFYLGRALGLPSAGAGALAIVFSLLPQTLYFEHLFLYTYPTAALLCLAGALFHAALRRPSFARWLWFFVTCAAIGWIRSMFHLAWFGVMLGLALWCGRPEGRRATLLAAVGPGAALLALYLKNLLIFGTFGALTFGPANVTTATIRNLPTPVRDAWIREGKLSPFAAISVYTGPRAYVGLLGPSHNPRWPAMMNVLEHPSNGQPNFNHWYFLEVNRRRRNDSVVYMRERPGDYAMTALRNVREYFQPSTGWHPHDDTPRSPHHRHRQVLGAYECAHNRVVHQLPLVGPVGVYLLTPLLIGWGAWRWWVWTTDRRRRVGEGPGAAGDTENEARAATLGFCLLQIAFVTVLSVLLAQGEAERYRYKIEAFIWLLGGLWSAQQWAHLRRRLAARAAAGAQASTAAR